MDKVGSRTSSDDVFIKSGSERFSFKSNGRTSAGEPTLVYDLSVEMDGGSDALSFKAALAGTLVVGTKPWRWITITMEGPTSFEVLKGAASGPGFMSTTLVFTC